MKKEQFKELTLPTSSETQGTHVILPLHNDVDWKGYSWWTRVVFRVRTEYFKYGDTIYYYKQLSNPQPMQRATKIMTMEGDLCKCSECVAGRKKVLNGARPEGYENCKDIEK